MQLAFDARLLIVDGGTASGLMKIAGETVAEMAEGWVKASPPPLVGFVPERLVAYPNMATQGDCACRVHLAPHHQYFVLVEDARAWGDEVTCMSRFVQHLATSIPAVALVVDGGLNTLREVGLYLQHGQCVVVLEGSERSADLVARATAHNNEQPLSQMLDESGLVDAQTPPAARARAIRNLSTIVKSDNVALFDVAAAPDAIMAYIESVLRCAWTNP
jgi:hypothetical protein